VGVGGGGGRTGNGVQTTSTCSQPQQEPKKRQRRPLRGLSPRAAVLVVAEPAACARLGVQRQQASTDWGWLANWG
jgi:hypothetical protein